MQQKKFQNMLDNHNREPKERYLILKETIVQFFPFVHPTIQCPERLEIQRNTKEREHYWKTG